MGARVGAWMCRRACGYAGGRSCAYLERGLVRESLLALVADVGLVARRVALLMVLELVKARSRVIITSDASTNQHPTSMGTK